MRNSGEDGANQFKALTESDAKIKVNIQEGGERYPNEQGHVIVEDYKVNEDGSVELLEATLNVSIGANESMHEKIMSNGLSDLNPTTQQLQNIETIKSNNLSPFDMAVATFGHEIEHTKNYNVRILLIETKKLKQSLNGGDSENRPQKIEGNILKDLGKKRN